MDHVTRDSESAPLRMVIEPVAMTVRLGIFLLVGLPKELLSDRRKRYVRIHQDNIG